MTLILATANHSSEWCVLIVPVLLAILTLPGAIMRVRDIRKETYTHSDFAESAFKYRQEVLDTIADIHEYQSTHTKETH